MISVLFCSFKKQRMGQYWLLVCPSKREYTTQVLGRKLSELFSSWTIILRQLIEDEWAGTRLICIGDYLGSDDLPATIRQDNLHLTSNESDNVLFPSTKYLPHVQSPPFQILKHHAKSPNNPSHTPPKAAHKHSKSSSD
jgi:hypothetical protein